jgi:diguanylate cyclase (GGDEF)-like protein
MRTVTFQAHVVILLLALLVGASAWGAGRLVASTAGTTQREQGAMDAVSAAFLNAESAFDAYLNTGNETVGELAVRDMTILNHTEGRGYDQFARKSADLRAFSVAQSTIGEWYSLAVHGARQVAKNQRVSADELIELQGYADTYQRESDALVKRLVDEGNHSTYLADLWSVLGAGICAAIIAAFAELAVVRRERRDRLYRQAHADYVNTLLGARDKTQAYELLEARLQSVQRGAHAVVAIPGEMPEEEVDSSSSTRRFALAFAGEDLGCAVLLCRRKLNSFGEARVHEAIGAAVPMIANLRDLATARDSALTDGLTGVANRRALEQELTRISARATRNGEPFAVILLDIDHFKQLNDTHGHEAGDQALVSVAKLLRDRSRAGDVVARYGGEEFVVLCPGADISAAGAVAESLREALEQYDGPPARFTASFGVAAFPASAADPDELVRTADKALYAAKRGGRNRVEYAAPKEVRSSPTGSDRL